METSERRRCLLITGGGMGDVCCLLTLLQAIRDGGDIDSTAAMGLTPGAEDVVRLAAGRSAIDEHLDWRCFGYHRLMGSGQPDDRLVELLREQELVLVYDPATTREVDFVRWCCGDRVVFLSSRLPPRRQQGRHLTEYLAEQLAERAELGALRPATIDLGPAGGDPGRVLLAPGAGDPLKCWPMAGWLALAERLEARGRRCWWWLGPSERGRFADAGLDSGRLLAGRTLEERLRRALSCDLYIGNDAGTSHLAAAVGIRTRAIWTPQGQYKYPAAWWRPLGEHVSVVMPPALTPPLEDVLQEL